VRIKDSCWSVGTIYDPSELPGVSTAGSGIGRGVTRYSVGTIYVILLRTYETHLALSLKSGCDRSGI
jgi:hypothetical protein